MTYDTAQSAEKVVLFGAFSDGGDLTELAELARTSGAEVVGELTQNRAKPNASTYLGKGKLEELAELCRAVVGDAVICDDELSPSQLKHIEAVVKVKVLDRTSLILDIFAQRALSAEGKAQVELAQYKYRLSRLSGLGVQLSRLGGGIGTRGPGESKLESDRRHIRRRIDELSEQLKGVRESRAVMRGKRERDGIVVASLVGYTNAGKSTLLNRLTDAEVLAEDKLFATLDTTTRRVKLPGGGEILLTDTVGFIRKLPHQLISAFRATLEELEYADVLIHVADASNDALSEQTETVYKTLDDLGLAGKPVITAFNKIDKIAAGEILRDDKAAAAFGISAATGEGVEGLLGGVEELLRSAKRRVTALVPYDKGALLSFVRNRADLLSEKHEEGGTLIELFADEEVYNRLGEYIC